MGNPIAILGLVLSFAQPQPLPLAGLQHLVRAHDLAGVAKLKAEWERGWSREWRLKRAEIEGIDHFKVGIELEWERPIGRGLVVERLESFELSGAFYSAEECELREGEPQCGRQLVLDDYGRLRFAAAGPTDGYFQLSVFDTDSGIEIALYRSKQLIMLSSDGPVLVPDDLSLAKGSPVAGIEKLRER